MAQANQYITSRSPRDFPREQIIGQADSPGGGRGGSGSSGGGGGGSGGMRVCGVCVSGVWVCVCKWGVGVCDV